MCHSFCGNATLFVAANPDFNLFAKKLLTETGECVKWSTNGSKHNQQEADMGNSVIESISPKAFAARHRVAVEKVYKWIESGELRAINTSTSTDIRPRYSILMSDIEKFEQQRASGAVGE